MASPGRAAAAADRAHVFFAIEAPFRARALAATMLFFIALQGDYIIVNGHSFRGALYLAPPQDTAGIVAVHYQVRRQVTTRTSVSSRRA